MERSHDRLVVTESKAKARQGLAILMGLVALSASLVFVRPGGVLGMAVGLPGFLFAGLLLPFWVRGSIWPQPTLLVDRTGVTDLSRTIGAGFVPWDSVTSMTMKIVSGQPFIAISVRDPADLLRRQSLKKRMLMRLNRRWGAEVFIATGTLPIDSGDLLAKMEEFRNSA